MAELDRHTVPLPGWHRVVTDDLWLLHLLARVCDPAAEVADVPVPVAEPFGTTVTRTGAVHKLVDPGGSSVVMAPPLPRERRRSSAIIAPHWSGCSVSRGSSGTPSPSRRRCTCTPIRSPFRTPAAFAGVVALVKGWREALWRLLSANRACLRLAPPRPHLVDLVPALRGMGTWNEAVVTVGGVELLVEGLLLGRRTDAAPPARSRQPRDDPGVLRRWGRRKW